MPETADRAVDDPVPMLGHIQNGVEENLRHGVVPHGHCSQVSGLGRKQLRRMWLATSVLRSKKCDGIRKTGSQRCYREIWSARGRWSIPVSSTVMQYTAQKLWHKLDLTPSQQEWVKTQKERGHRDTLSLIQIDGSGANGAEEGRWAGPSQARLLRQTRIRLKRRRIRQPA